MPATIPYISPDNTKTIFSAPSTQYSFHQPSHTFTGQNSTFMTPDVEDGICFLSVRFNYAGELENGTIKVVGGIPSLGVPNDSILLQGSVIKTQTFGENELFRANFIFNIDIDNPALGYDSCLGVWNTYMMIPGWPDFFHRYLFRRTWGQNSAPLNSYIGQVSNIV